MNETAKTRLHGITAQIDAYAWMRHDNGKLSREQKKHLRELAYQISAYGDEQKQWYDMAMELINE